MSYMYFAHMRISVYNFHVDKKRSKPWIVPQLSTRLRLTAGLAFARKATIGTIERKKGVQRPTCVPHPVKDIPIGTLKAIERQTGIKFK